ncbi:MAG: hypothetical protein AB7O91_09845 [Sphingomonas sp.]
MIRLIPMLTLGAACALAGTAATAQNRGGQAAGSADDQRLICRRIQETGSLVRTIRQCFTRAEWDRIAESARRGAQRTASELSSGQLSN